MTSFQSIMAYFSSRGIRFQTDLRKSAIHCFFQGPQYGMRFRFTIGVDKLRELVQCSAKFPLSVAEENRTPVAELIIRANYGVKIGRMEMDFDSGNLFFRASSFVVEHADMEKIVRRLTGLSVGFCDLLTPELMQCLYSKVKPQLTAPREVPSLQAAQEKHNTHSSSESCATKQPSE